MIRHGRRVINRSSVAGLYGLKMTAFKGHRRRQPPWDVPGHPLAVNLDPLGERPETRVAPKQYLYDEEQARAFAAGETVPELPADDHPEDLLTERDAAAHLDLNLVEFRDLVKSLRVPEPDVKVFGVNHWYRNALDEHPIAPGRGTGSGPARRNGAARQRMKDVVGALPPDHLQDLGTTELARRARVSLATARKFLREPELTITATFGGKIGPGLATWDAFMVEMHKLAGLKKYSAIDIRITEK